MAWEASQGEVKGQLELFGALLTDLAGRKEPAFDGALPPSAPAAPADALAHRVVRDGREFAGSWEQIVRGLRDANVQYAGRSVLEFMQTEARRGFSITGVRIPTHDAESFIRGSADAGLLRIVR